MRVCMLCGRTFLLVLQHMGTVLACSQNVFNVSEMKQLLVANLKSTVGPNSILAARTGFLKVYLEPQVVRKE